MPAAVKLPLGEHAIVDPAKVRDYLLSTSHPVGRFKAQFFVLLGYSAHDYTRLLDDLRVFARDLDAQPAGHSPFGSKYSIRGTLTGPNRSASVTTVWIYLHGDDFPRFVTAYPDAT